MEKKQGIRHQRQNVQLSSLTIKEIINSCSRVMFKFRKTTFKKKRKILIP